MPLPTLILLPGLDGTGKLYVEFLAKLGSAVDARIVAYPKTTPLGYDELEPLVRAALPLDRPLKVFPRWLRAPSMWGSFSPSRAPDRH